MAQADAVFFWSMRAPASTPADRGFADLVRKSGKPTILVANKSEGRAGAAGALDSYALGLGDPVAISAEHGEGLAGLYDALRAALPEATARSRDARTRTMRSRPASKPIRIAIVGRPNTGKSTLINRLVGEERLLTGPEAGITRDAIAVDFDWRGRPLRIHDTAGLRRRSRIDEKLEKLSVADALNAVRFAEVVIVLIDAQAPFEEQDIRIADLVEREGRAIVIAINKSDLMRAAGRRSTRLREDADRLLPQIKGVPRRRAVGAHWRGARPADGGGDGKSCGLESARADGRAQSLPRPGGGGASAARGQRPPRAARLHDPAQIAAADFCFVLVARAAALPETYRRYLVNGLREAFALPGTPIRLTLRAKANPYRQAKAPQMWRIRNGVQRNDTNRIEKRTS